MFTRFFKGFLTVFMVFRSVLWEFSWGFRLFYVFFVF